MRLTALAVVSVALITAGCGGDNAPASQGAKELDTAMNTIARDSSEAASLTRRKCGSCHALTRNIRKLGPTLKGIYNKKPTISDVPFEAWDVAALNSWLQNPRAVKKNTRMAIPGISNEDERRQIIDYLKLL